MTRSFRLLALAALAVPALGQAAPGAVVKTPQVRAELVAQAPEGVVPGKPLWLGLEIQHQPHWHTYWKNPGDSGLPTSFAWKLPPGFAASEINWPTPRKLPIGPLLNYGYEGKLLLPVAVTVPAGFAADRLDVSLHADWLVCKDVCIPESGDFAISVPARAATAGDAALFDASRAAQPQPAAGAKASAALEAGKLVVKVTGLPAAWQGKALAFLPETPGVINNAAEPEVAWQDGAWTAKIAVDPQRSAGPALMPAVLTAPGQPAGLRVEVRVTTEWPPLAAAEALPPLGAATVTTPAVPQPPIVGLGLALLFALAGGMLLNIMPCVFPVLSLKVLGFAGHAHERRKVVAAGLAYTVGVVASFVALAGLLLALRAGGEQLGWGFQLQSPVFVAVLAMLFTLIGLNLAGVFEVGSLLPNQWACARARHPLVDSLLTGVLAVAVASPCTAPFMGASLGVAVALPAPLALLVFATLGLGMALPFLLASVWPAVGRLLPRPGAWMSHFKALMAFPMFATVIWLVWVVGLQAGIDGAAELLGSLLALAFVAWAVGSRTLGRRARWAFRTIAVGAFAASVAWTGPTLREVAASTSHPEAGWEPWSPARVAELSAAGQPVFVEFTAAWCVTCQINKRATLGKPEVQADFEKRRVVRLRADWTRRDAAITAELARLGRSGVPVYALYTPGVAEPRLMSELLTVGEVHETLSHLPAITTALAKEP